MTGPRRFQSNLTAGQTHPDGLAGHTAFAMDLVPTHSVSLKADASLIPASQIQVLPFTGVEEQAD